MIREPVFAGSWYPGNPVEMNRVLDEYLSESPVAPGAAYGVIAPHAGWVYSGRVAGAVYGCVNVPGRVRWPSWRATDRNRCQQMSRERSTISWSNRLAEELPWFS